MKKFKFIIIILVIFIIIILTSILIVNNTENNLNKTNNSEPGNSNLEPNMQLIEDKSISDYKNISNIVNNILSNDNKQIQESVLIAEYKNSSEKMPNIPEKGMYFIDRIYKYEAEISITTNFVYGYILDRETMEKSEYNLIINIDYINNTFELAPMGKVYLNYVDYDKLEINDKIQNEIKEIKVNKYNTFNKVNGLGQKDIMQFYFEQYILNMVYNPEKAYRLLDEDYRNRKFGDYQNFQKYTEENKNKIEQSKIIKYKIKELASYTEYLCIDNFNNYYIFKETAPMEYTVLLDQYTIDDEIFVEEYKKSNTSIKAQLDLTLFQQMLNRKDYEKAYSKLNETFKNEYFSTVNDLKKYVEENLYEYGKLNFEEVTSSGNEYKIKTSIVNMESADENKIKRFIVQIEEDGTYNIAFNV